MIRVYSLLWTLIAAVLVSALSFFYIRGDGRGFPFSFSEAATSPVGAVVDFQINFLLAAADVLFWWLVFSMLWIILKNYVFDM